MSKTTCVVYDDDGGTLELTGEAYAVRCAKAVAQENWPDARWCLEVLNKYGHLVAHPGSGSALDVLKRIAAVTEVETEEHWLDYMSENWRPNSSHL
jgi:hypothetical protein